jgi:hypothetical protein
MAAKGICTMERSLQHQVEQVDKGEYSSQSNQKHGGALIIKSNGQVLVDHACNPRYSGGRNQENHSSKLAREKSL